MGYPKLSISPPKSAECVEGGGVHVGVVLVFSAHAPAEAVSLGGDSGVNGPSGRDDHFAVLHDDVAGLVGRAHEMEDARVVGEVEIKVNLGAAHVGVGGHGVPDAAGGEVRDPHDQLATARALKVDVLVDGAAVAGFGGADFDRVRVLFADERGGVVGVRGIAEQVKDGRRLGVGGVEGDFLRPAADVEAVKIGELVSRAVDADFSVAADVERAQ